MSENQLKRKRAKVPPIIILLLIIVCIGLSLASGMINVKSEGQTENISYSEALNKLNSTEDKQIDKVCLSPNNNTVSLYNSSKNITYVANIPDSSIFMESYNKMDIAKEIELEIVYKDETSFAISLLTFLMSALPTIMIMLYLYIIFKKMSKDSSLKKMLTGQGNVTPADTSNYSFNDVAGIDHELMEVQEVVEMLKNPVKYRETGAKIPKGILLSGEPGTGKTLIAKAIAGEAGVKFYECAGSNFDDTYVGVGASKVRELFDQARKNAPSIIFIDEIDTVAKQRYGHNSTHEQTLNQLLSEMDGFKETENVILIAATNFIEVLDPAITRPGRFDRIINIPLPDCKGREAILKVHSRNKQFLNEEIKDTLLKELAKKTAGMSGANLENILNESAIIAVRNNRSYISEEDINEAFVKIVVGISKNDKEVSESQKLLVAVHEAGHAITSRIKRPDVEILEASIIPRGTAGGYTLFADKNENNISRRDELMNDIIVSLGGRAAEQNYFGSISIGASSDLNNANKVAHKMVYAYAMGNDLQLVRLYGENDYNKKLESSMFHTVENIMETTYSEALEILKKHSELLFMLTNALIEKPTLNSSELEEIFSKFNV